MLNWYALNSKPHSEKFVYDGLVARGIEAYLPLWRAPRQGTQAAGLRPFFPCYLFAHADLEVIGLSALQYLPGVRHLVFCGDRPACVPQAAIDRILDQLQEMEKSIRDASGQSLVPGDRVVITRGPLVGLEAIFDRGLSSGERVRLLVNFIQKGARIEIEREYVQKIVMMTQRHDPSRNAGQRLREVDGRMDSGALRRGGNVNDLGGSQSA